MRDRAIAERGGFELEAEIVTLQGRHRWIRITASVECEGDMPVRIFGMKQDITDEKLLADRTRYLAEFDVMTGLANRSAFQTRLPALAPDDVLMLLDLDGFKGVNDTHGHPAGDAALRQVARRLTEACGGASLIARIGGDEFAILLYGADEAACAEMASRIAASMQASFTIGGENVRLGISIGLARVEDANAADIYARADAALYEAKAAGRGTFRRFRDRPASPASLLTRSLCAQG